MEKLQTPGKMHFLLVSGKGSTLSKTIFCCFAGRLQRYPTLSSPYPKPWKNCKTWKNAFFAGSREGPNAIQRYPSLSQTLEKLQNLERMHFLLLCGRAQNLEKLQNTGKMHFWLVSGKGSTLSKTIFCCFAGGPQRYPTLSVIIPDQTLKKLQNMEKCILCWFPGRVQRYPTLSVLISDPRKIAKRGKKAFFAVLREGQNLEKLQNLEKCIFCWFPGRPQRYPTLSVLIPDQTLEKLQNLEKCIFCWFPGRPQRYPTLSVLIPDPRKIAKPGKKCIFCWFAGGSQNVEKLQNLEKCIFCCFAGGPQRYPTLSVIIRDPRKIAKLGKMFFLLVSGKGSTLSNAIRPYLRP